MQAGNSEPRDNSPESRVVTTGDIASLSGCCETLIAGCSKRSQSERAKNRQAEAYLSGTLERGD